jgi:predicted AlkP superfamily pyrophosphatase or phosphodiesterase
MRATRSLIWAIIAFLAAAALMAGPVRHVVLISVDGLMPVSYLKSGELGLAVPNLVRMTKEGAFARGVVGVLPTVTYPSHTTLITGVPPRIHGITSNTLFDPEGTSNDGWSWYARDVRVPTLVSAARARRLTTAAVFWPVTVGLDADFNVPEFWRTGSEHPADLALLEQLSTPRLLEAVGSRRGRPIGYPLDDDDKTDIAIFCLETYRPALTLLHLGEVDHEEHEHGPFSAQAKAATERADARVGRVLRAIEAAGLSAETVVAVVSDHGFLPITRTLRPNVLLRAAGLLEADAQGRVKRWRAVFHADGGSAALRVKDAADAALVDRVRALFEPLLHEAGSGLREILDARLIAEMGGSAEAPIFLNAREGASFSSSAAGEWSSPSAERGQHGYAPNREELYATLIVKAPGLGPRDLGVVPMTSIAATLAGYLGLTLAAEAGPPLWEQDAP